MELKVGDLVTRRGDDVHRVVDINHTGEMIKVICVVAPSDKWTAIGVDEWNMVYRYALVEEGKR